MHFACSHSCFVANCSALPTPLARGYNGATTYGRCGLAERGRVVVVSEYGKPFEIREYELPEPEPGAIILKITQAGICGSDLHVWRGDQVNVPLPATGRVMGHEGTGVVYKLGDGVTTDSLGTGIAEGDRLMHVAVFPCYRCHMCLRGDTNWCVNRVYPSADVYPYFTGTYADYLYLPPRHPAFRVPDAPVRRYSGPGQLRPRHRDPGVDQRGRP